MSQPKSVKPILLGMQRHINNVQSDCTCGEEVFLKNRTIQDAVIYNLQNVGEYAKQLPESVMTTYGSVPWQQIIKFRDKAAHHYAKLKMDLIWQIATQSIPELGQAVDQMLQDIP